ncbi:MAG: hypothetical protein LBL72_07590 [Candidatus Accumulibacter sp.]|jgi:hypothetical protein|nr:hypothetical protein [Accumulibacter sp.]
MIRHGLTGVLAGYPGLVDHRFEVAPLRVAQQVLQFARQPELDTLIAATEAISAS